MRLSNYSRDATWANDESTAKGGRKSRNLPIKPSMTNLAAKEEKENGTRDVEGLCP